MLWELVHPFLYYTMTLLETYPFTGTCAKYWQQRGKQIQILEFEGTGSQGVNAYNEL